MRIDLYCILPQILCANPCMLLKEAFSKAHFNPVGLKKELSAFDLLQHYKSVNSSNDEY